MLVIQALEVNLLTSRPDGAGDDGDETSSLTTVVDPHGVDAQDRLVELEELERINRALGQLPDREASILRVRFGFAPYSPMTLHEVGNALDLTRERDPATQEAALEALIAGLGRRGGENSVSLDEAS